MNNLMTVLAASALILYLSSFRFGYMAYIGALFHLGLNAALWISTGYPPFIGGYGSMVFFSFLLALKSFITIPVKLKKYMVLAAIVMLAASFLMPHKTVKIEAVLASIWLGVHVPLFFLGYLSLTTAFIASFLKDNEKFEEREMGFALFFCFAGLLTGAIWAEVSWGKFWGWDSKEAWALSTWLFVASYFHFTGRNEKRLALFAAFISMVMTYLVISFILPGMHSYIR